jgi:hypothetical protein
MEWKEKWVGNQAEVNKLVDFVITKFIPKECSEFSHLSKKDLRKLFCEAFGRNLVQEQLTDMMLFILDEEAWYARNE